MLSVFVPQVENDFIGQYYDYDCEMKHFEDPAWGINLRDISWFRYSFEPISFPPRVDDMHYNYITHCHQELRIAHISDFENNLVNSVKIDLSSIVIPNPFTDRLTISLGENEKEINKVMIFDILGKDLTNQFIIEKNKSSLNMYLASENEIKPGIYYCRIITSNVLYSFKLIKAN